MILGRVQGQVVSTIKHEAYANRRILLLDRIDPGGKELGGYLVAIDAVLRRNSKWFRRSGAYVWPES